MRTKSYGTETSWSLGTCSSNQTYSSNKEYILECCLDPGMYILNCKDSYGDGWNGGLIQIQSTKYCANFKSGSEKAIQVTIVAPGKYSFGLVNIVEFLDIKI